MARRIAHGFGRSSAARRAYSAAVARMTRSSIAATAARAQQ